VQSANAISASLIIALLIEAGEIQSLNYTAPLPGSPYAQAGTRLDLTNGDITSTAIAVDGATGALFVRGDITADSLALVNPLLPGGPVTVRFDDYFEFQYGDAEVFRYVGSGDPDREAVIGFPTSGGPEPDVILAARDAVSELRALVGVSRFGAARMEAEDVNAGNDMSLTLTPTSINVKNQPMFAVERYAIATSLLPAVLVGAAPVDLAGVLVIPTRPFDREVVITAANLLAPSATGVADYYMTLTGGVSIGYRTRWNQTSTGSSQSFTQTVTQTIPANAAPVTVTIRVARISAATNMASAGGADLNRIHATTFRSSP
jgi:hypothetical protein